MSKMTMYHIPVCPFSQRLEILLELKGLRDLVEFHVIDITQPRPDWLLEKTQGTTSLPVLELADGSILKESLVILRYLDEAWPERQVARRDPFERAVERLLIAMEGPFTVTGYTMVMNQDRGKRAGFVKKMDAHYLAMSKLLERYAPEGPFLFEEFGLAEAVFTPMFMRFWFLEHYEDYQIPEGPDHARVRQWHAACLAHPAAQQVSRDEIVKLYYDYAKGAGNGALLPGRAASSFAFRPHWQDRPMPPRDKDGTSASDAELGLHSA
jgi:glutathione S-transferase